MLSQDPTVCLALRCPDKKDALLLRTKPAPTTGHDSSRLEQDLMPHSFRGAP